MAAPSVDPTVLSAAPARTRWRRALVVANPIAGRGQGAKAARELECGLRAAGVDAEVWLTAGRGDAFRHLREASNGLDLVVAVGGDGTVREVLSGLVDPEVALGILPLGTANVLAQHLGLPRDIHAALEILARGRVGGLDVMEVNGYLSCLVTGVGLDGMAVHGVEARRKGPISKLTYVDALLRTVVDYRPPKLEVEIDGRWLPEPVGLVLVSNTGHYGGFMRLDRGARIDDRAFEVYLFRHGTRFELVRAALRGSLFSLPGGPVRMQRAQRVAVRSEQPVAVQVDGDARGYTPIEICLSPRQYRVVLP